MNMYSRRRNGGFLIIMLLVVIVVGIFFYMQLAGGGAGGRLPDASDSSGSDTSNKPWDFEDSIGNGLNFPLNDSQFKPKERFERVSIVKDKESNQSRGKLNLILEPDGQFFAGWSGTYRKDGNIEYDIVMASAQGNVDPTIIYEDLDGKEDSSLLYFIAHGKFVFMRTEKGRVSRPGGELFVTGFFRPNGTCFGNVHLTSDRVKQTVFDFGQEYQK